MTYRYESSKEEIIQRLLKELPYRFTITGLVSMCMHSVLELGETGELNEFLKTVERIGRGG
jgi:hypothetical protein